MQKNSQHSVFEAPIIRAFAACRRKTLKLKALSCQINHFIFEARIHEQILLHSFCSVLTYHALLIYTV